LLDSAVACDGSQPQYHIDLLEAYRWEGRLDDALRIGLAAAKHWPESAAIDFALGLLFCDRAELDEAISRLRQAIAREPGYAGAHMRLGQALLARGDCKSGWPEYEWRFRLPGLPLVMPPTSQPKWDGTNAAGGTLLLVCGEGFGDTIQFARYIPLVAQRCRKLVIACSAEMRPFIIQQRGADHTFGDWADMPAYDVYCVLTSVPGILNEDIAAPLALVPYIRTDAARTAVWRERLDAAISPGLYRVGLVWAGRPTHPNDRRRSMDFGHLVALTAIPGVALVGLLQGAAPQMPELKGPAPFLNCGPQIGDFIDTAAIIENLDLVISVDTATAHVAGAMHKPAWLLLPFAADWRWMLGRPDTPWYPPMRLFRQAAPGRWSEVIDAVALQLRNVVNAGR
jgi:hypothetical protein